MTQEGTQPKKLWSAPVVTIHGSVEEITQGRKAVGIEDDIRCNSGPLL